MRTALFLAVIASINLGASSSAHADAHDADDDVRVTADGPSTARLEERKKIDEPRWSFVCTLPCGATVHRDGAYEHRLVDGERERPLPLDRPGAVNVDYHPGDPGAGIALGVLGGALALGGFAIGGPGAIEFLLSLNDDGAFSNRAEGRLRGGLMWLGGAAVLSAGAALIGWGVLLSKPKLRVVQRSPSTN